MSEASCGTVHWTAYLSYRRQLFLQKTDIEQLDIILSKRSAIMEPEQWTIFIKTVAVKMSDLMYIC